ncbi:hypothetical protein F4818DRAFT_402400 [Hypoxylon cercidicola]|nr:hypothetical protein F4818DRAFT_402400 [Hypoxylon cercidicola]
MTVSMATNRATSPSFGDSNPQESKSASGFTPLPPIRRTSTFDLLTKKKLGGDEEDSTPSPVGSSDDDTPPVPPMKESAVYQNGNGQTPSHQLGGQASAHLNQPQNFMQPPPQQHPAFANGSAHVPNGFIPGRGGPQFNGIQQQMFMGRGGPAGPQHLGQIHGQPNASPMHDPGQPFSQMGGNPVQKFPPGGQWKLEESHLSQPLIQHKPRSPPQPQPGYDSYDKETEGQAPPKFQKNRPRNNSNVSNSIPPVSAERYRGLFAAPEPPQAFSSPQTSHPAFRSQGEQGSRDVGLTKEMDDSSVPGEEQSRRGSGFFGLNNRRNTGAEPGPQHPDQNLPAKEKSAFLGPPIPKTSTWDHDDKPASMKKRLSELRGMIKGVGNAKDGAKDDQPTKPSTSYIPRPSMQGPIRANTGLPGQGAPIQSSPLSQPPAGIGRSSTNESGPAEHQRAPSEDEHKKPGGGFLGGLFNKQGPKPQDLRQQLNQPTPPAAQRPQQQQHPQPNQQFRPGQMVHQAQPHGPHPIYPPGQPFYGGQPGQQGVRQPMLQGQPNPQENTAQSPTSPQFLGMAQAVMIRRPSEITVSPTQAGGSPLSPDQGSQMTSQQGPQTNIRPPTGEDMGVRSPHKQVGGDGDFSVSGALPKNSPQLPHQASQERLDVNGSSIATRTTPNRKPVGSGFARQDGASAATTRSGDSEPAPASAEDERRLSGQLPSGQQSPTLGKLGHVRQTSLPSPGRSPVQSQPGQVTSPAAGGAQLPPRGPLSPHDRQVLGQPHGAPQGQPGVSQPSHNPQLDPRHPWNPISTFSNQQRPGPPNQTFPGQLPRPLGGPAPNAEQHNAISKFFGKPVNQAQPPKEMNQKSAASKFLNAFKRGSKQSEHSQAHEQQRPPPGHPTPPHMRPHQPGGPQVMTRPPISGPSPAGPLGPMSNLPQNLMQPGQNRGPMPPPMMYGPGRGVPPPHMQPGGSQKSQQILGLQPQIPGQERRASTQRFEPQYDHVPIPRGYEAVHGYGNAGTIAPSPYNVGRPSPPPASQQFQPLVQGAPQQWDPRTAQAQQAAGPYGQPPIQIPPNQQGMPQSIQRQTDSESTTPTPSEQGTFLDMTPTPPRQSHEELQIDRQPTHNMLSQAIHGQLSQQPQVGTQVNLQRAQGLDTQTPASSNWGSAPDSARSPQGKQNLLTQGATIRAKPSDPNISPPSDGGDVPRSQPQHIATAMNNNLRPPQVIPPEPSNAARSYSPTSPPSRQIPGVPNSSPPIIQGPEERPGSAAAGRLVSKMSVTNELPRNASLSPEIVTNRAASVSPEPPGPRSSPYHQVSNNSLNINVDRANDVRTEVEEDIYDATPRMNNSQAQDATHENTKYAGSERGRPVVNGTAMAGGAAAGAVVAGTTIDVTPPEPGSEESTPPPRQIPMNMEPEEKILVDQPVELAAVNDDDDGLPAMSATSYPGQEWNPYAAGEFGDWE